MEVEQQQRQEWPKVDPEPGADAVELTLAQQDGSTKMSGFTEETVRMSGLTEDSMKMSNLTEDSVKASYLTEGSVKVSDHSVRMSDLPKDCMKMSNLMAESVKVSDLREGSVKMSNLMEESVKASYLTEGSVKVSDLIEDSVRMSDLPKDSMKMSNLMAESVKVSDLREGSVKMSNHIEESVKASYHTEGSVRMSDLKANIYDTVTEETKMMSDPTQMHQHDLLTLGDDSHQVLHSERPPQGNGKPKVAMTVYTGTRRARASAKEHADDSLQCLESLDYDQSSTALLSFSSSFDVARSSSSSSSSGGELLVKRTKKISDAGREQKKKMKTGVASGEGGINVEGGAASTGATAAVPKAPAKPKRKVVISPLIGRRRTSCERCRKGRRKCDGLHPCDTCKRKGYGGNCTYAFQKRSAPPKSWKSRATVVPVVVEKRVHGTRSHANVSEESLTLSPDSAPMRTFTPAAVLSRPEAPTTSQLGRTVWPATTLKPFAQLYGGFGDGAAIAEEEDDSCDYFDGADAARSRGYAHAPGYTGIGNGRSADDGDEYDSDEEYVEVSRRRGYARTPLYTGIGNGGSGGHGEAERDYDDEYVGGGGHGRSRSYVRASITSGSDSNDESVDGMATSNQTKRRSSSYAPTSTTSGSDSNDDYVHGGKEAKNHSYAHKSTSGLDVLAAFAVDGTWQGKQ